MPRVESDADANYGKLSFLEANVNEESDGYGTDIASYEGSAARVIVNLETGYRQGGDAAGDTFSGRQGQHSEFLPGGQDGTMFGAAGL